MEFISAGCAMERPGERGRSCLAGCHLDDDARNVIPEPLGVGWARQSLQCISGIGKDEGDVLRVAVDILSHQFRDVAGLKEKAFVHQAVAGEYDHVTRKQGPIAELWTAAFPDHLRALVP